MSFALVLLAQLGCQSSPPAHIGKVVDIWGTAIPGATIAVSGSDESLTTDDEGAYRLPVQTGELTVKAGREGYIQRHASFASTGDEAQPAPTIALYPQPETAGFYMVTQSAYASVPSAQIELVGDGIHAYRGIAAAPGLASADAQPSIVYHTELPPEQVSRLQLSLVRLQFVESAPLPGAFGRTNVAVNLHVADTESPLSVEPMRSPHDYLLSPKDALTPGIYAIETQKMLTTASRTMLNEVAPEVRIVFPFKVAEP